MLRLLQGESLDGVSLEHGVEIDRLEQWRDKALAGLEDVRAAVRQFVEDDNAHWRPEKLEFKTPVEARREYM